MPKKYPLYANFADFDTIFVYFESQAPQNVTKNEVAKYIFKTDGLRAIIITINYP